MPELQSDLGEARIRGRRWPGTLDELAIRTGIPRHTARISADAMVAVGLIELHRNEYRNAAAADAFLSGQGFTDLRPLLHFLNRVSYLLWMNLDEAIRSGQGPNRQHGGFSEDDQRTLSLGIGAFAAAAGEIFGHQV
jgi:hypothetical protein